MFGLFKKTTPEEKLEKQYKKLLEEAYKLSRVDRRASDEKMAEAESIGQQLAALGK